MCTIGSSAFLRFFIRFFVTDFSYGSFGCDEPLANIFIIKLMWHENYAMLACRIRCLYYAVTARLLLLLLLPFPSFSLAIMMEKPKVPNAALFQRCAKHSHHLKSAARSAARSQALGLRSFGAVGSALSVRPAMSTYAIKCHKTELKWLIEKAKSASN